MKNYWNSLNNRERWMVALAAITVIVYLFYLLIYSPLKTAVSNKTTQVSEKTETLKWLQQARLQDRSSSGRKSITNSQLLTLLADQLKKSSIKRFSYQIQQTANGDISLSFSEVPFKPLMDWLEKINKDYAITIKQLNAERSDKSGLVKLLVIISAGS